MPIAFNVLQVAMPTAAIKAVFLCSVSSGKSQLVFSQIIFSSFAGKKGLISLKWRVMLTRLRLDGLISKEVFLCNHGLDLWLSNYYYYWDYYDYYYFFITIFSIIIIAIIIINIVIKYRLVILGLQPAHHDVHDWSKLHRDFDLKYVYFIGGVCMDMDILFRGYISCAMGSFSLEPIVLTPNESSFNEECCTRLDWACIQCTFINSPSM